MMWAEGGGRLAGDNVPPVGRSVQDMPHRTAPHKHVGALEVVDVSFPKHFLQLLVRSLR